MEPRHLIVICSVLSCLLFGEVAMARIPSSPETPSCLDEDGRQVDWYIAYKFPELSEEGAPFNSGHAYAYITSGISSKDRRQPTARRGSSSILQRLRSLFGNANTQHTPASQVSNRNSSTSDRESNRSIPENLEWAISSKLISDHDSIVLRTLNIAYNQKSDKINSIFYNDQPPEDEERSSLNSRSRSSGQKAHAKGALIIDDITGSSVWLTHSTPHFPPRRSDSLKFFDNSKKYGQTFMCIQFDVRDSGSSIVDHLVNMNPLVYDTQISQRLYSMIPNLHDLKVSGRRVRKAKKGSTTKLAQQIKTKAGQELNIYSKSATFGEDLYSGWIDSELKTTLYVETWRNGAGNPLNSSCPPDNYQVNNVKDLKVNENGKRVVWSYHQDHSKWAVSDEKKAGIVCISDINRMQSQFKRGGGAVCIKCPSCWSVFSNTILELEPCPYKGRKNPINH